MRCMSGLDSLDAPMQMLVVALLFYYTLTACRTDVEAADGNLPLETRDLWSAHSSENRMLIEK
jgi:hypothetical protein